MEAEHFFVVLQDTSDGGKNTIYPEVHHVYSDDTFSPAVDAAEQNVGDISVIVDLDETGVHLLSAQSISPGWQVVEATMEGQALDRGQQSRLLAITGTQARQPTDIPELNGSFDAQVSRGIKLIEKLKDRNAELRRVLELPR